MVANLAGHLVGEVTKGSRGWLTSFRSSSFTFPKFKTQRTLRASYHGLHSYGKSPALILLILTLSTPYGSKEWTGEGYAAQKYLQHTSLPFNQPHKYFHNITNSFR